MRTARPGLAKAGHPLKDMRFVICIRVFGGVPAAQPLGNGMNSIRWVAHVA
jgi:hypothetical protein